MRSPYKLSYKIESKLFNGVVIPTAEKQGYTMANQNEIVAMMAALAKKYHTMTKEQRKTLISIAERNIEDRLSSLRKETDESKDQETN